MELNLLRAFRRVSGSRLEQFTMEYLIQGINGSSWDAMVAVDRLVELEVLREIPTPEGTPGQYRMFTMTGRA